MILQVHAVAFQALDPCIDARNLNAKISRAGRWQELLHIYTKYHATLDNIHIATLFTRLASLANSTDHQKASIHHSLAYNQLVVRLLSDVETQLHHLSARQVANIIFALSKLSLQQCSAPQYTRVFCILLDRARHDLGFAAFKPQELANLVYALCLLEAQGPAPSLVGKLWDNALLDDFCLAVAHKFDQVNAYDLSQLVYAFAKLGYRPTAPWLLAWLQHADRLLPSFTLQGLANAAWAVSKLTAIDSSTKLTSHDSHQHAQQRKLGSHGTHDSHVSYWQYASEQPTSTHGSNSQSNHTDSTTDSQGVSFRTSAVLCNQEERRLVRGSSAQGADCAASQQQSSCTLYAATGAWLQRCLSYAALHTPRLKPQEVCNLLWALGHSTQQQQQQRSERPQQSHNSKAAASPITHPQCVHGLVSAAAGLLPACSSQDLSSLLHALALLNYTPDNTWLEAFYVQTSTTLGSFSCYSLCNLLRSLSALQLQPPAGWRQQVMVKAGGMLELCEPRHMTGMLHSIASLGWVLPPRWLVRFQGASLAVFGSFNAQDFANTAWALARLQVNPDKR